MCENVIIIGAGGHGRVVADIIKKSGDCVFGFLDSDLSKQDVIGRVEDCVKYFDKKFVIAIGNNAIRKKISQEYNLEYYTAVHPSAVIGENVEIGEGTVVMANAVINPNTYIGKHCIMNTSSVTEHDNVISDYVHISPGAILCGTVKIGECTHIGAGTAVKNNVSITADVVVGCGGCVVKDINECGTYAGVPAKKIK